jgi:hypothetical protein
MHVGGRFPLAKAWARTCAGGATFFAVNAIVEAEFFFNMERLVLAFLMLVPNDIVRARNNTTCTSCT